MRYKKKQEKREKENIYHICEMHLFILNFINLWGPTSDFVFMYRNAIGL